MVRNFKEIAALVLGRLFSFLRYKLKGHAEGASALRFIDGETFYEKKKKVSEKSLPLNEFH